MSYSSGKLRHADGVEAGVDVDDFAGDGVAEVRQEVERAAGDAGHAGVFLEEGPVAARAHQALAAADAGERQRAHGARR
jgi:hypothetical protein